MKIVAFSSIFDDDNFMLDTLIKNLAKMNETPISIHANFIKSKDKKKAAMEAYGLWIHDGFATTGETKCKHFDMSVFVSTSTPS